MKETRCGVVLAKQIGLYYNDFVLISSDDNVLSICSAFIYNFMIMSPFANGFANY